VSSAPADPLSVSDEYVSDFQSDVDVQVYDSLDDMLAADNVDALDITARLDVHHTAALAGIQAGKHCLVQKPLAVSVAAARAMVEAARANGVSLGVMENLRYAPGVRMAHWLIDQGYLGDLQMLARWSIGTHDWSPDGIVADTPWRHQKLLGGAGASLDIGVHLLHEFRYLAGRIASVSAVTRIFEPTRTSKKSGLRVDCEVDDAFFATLVFGSGAIGQLTFTWAGHGEPAGLPEGRVIFGSRGCLKGDTLFRDGECATALAELFETRVDPHTRAAWFPYGLSDTFALAYEDFVRAVAERRDPEASGAAGLADLAAAFAICESSALQRPVAVDEVLDGRIATYQADIDRHFGFR
jgi:predicted dehydrogenase